MTNIKSLEEIQDFFSYNNCHKKSSLFLSAAWLKGEIF